MAHVLKDCGKIADEAVEFPAALGILAVVEVRTDKRLYNLGRLSRVGSGCKIGDDCWHNPARPSRKAETPTVDEPSGGTPEEVAVPQKRVSSKQRRLSLDEYRTAYLQVPKITDRKPVFVSGEVRDRLDGIVRRLGGRGMSVSGLVENLARLHLETYREDIEQWRKL